RIDKLGGMLRAIEAGYVQGEIQKAAYEYQRAIERKEQVVVGVNQVVADKETPIPTMRIDPNNERAQVERLRALRERRNSARTSETVTEVERRARSGENLMPAITDAV